MTYAISSYIRISLINCFNMKNWNFLIAVCLLFAFGCQKDVTAPEPEPPTVEDTDEQLTRDSIYYYYNLYSYWTDSIPDYDVLRTFTEPYGSNTEVLNALKALTPFYANYGGSIDRFSYLVEDDDTNGQLSSARGFRMDTNVGYGMYFSWVIVTDTEAAPVIYFVEGGSPAQVAGVTRGSILVELNGDDDLRVPYDCESEGGACYVESAGNINFQNALNTALNAASFDMRVQPIEGPARDFTLSSATYEIDPILADTVYNYSAKKIGYFAFSSFEEVTGNNQNFQNFERIFSDFASEAVTDLIIDMRYNTGGYVSTAEYLANKIIGPSGDQRLMFTYDVNDYLSQFKTGNNAEFGDVYFDRDNSLSVNTVYFLVTEQTASAAELLINVLKPYLNVVLIAETDRTYGKPVGFFEQRIMDSVSLWATSFKTINADNESDYWDGLSVDYDYKVDDIFTAFGDPEESMTAFAISLSTGGNGTSGNRAAVPRAGSVTSSGTSTRSKVGLINKPDERNLLKKRD